MNSAYAHFNNNIYGNDKLDSYNDLLVNIKLYISKLNDKLEDVQIKFGIMCKTYYSPECRCLMNKYKTNIIHHIQQEIDYLNRLQIKFKNMIDSYEYIE